MKENHYFDYYMKDKYYFDIADASDIINLYKTTYHTIYATDTITQKEVAIADLLRTEQDTYIICETDKGEPMLRYPTQLRMPHYYV